VNGIFNFAFGARDLAAKRTGETLFKRLRVERVFAARFRERRRRRGPARRPGLALAQRAKRGGRQAERGSDLRQGSRTLVIKRARTGERGLAGLFHALILGGGSAVVSAHVWRMPEP
jgi:hypothetical protein